MLFGRFVLGVVACTDGSNKNEPSAACLGIVPLSLSSNALHHRRTESRDVQKLRAESAHQYFYGVSKGAPKGQQSLHLSINCVRQESLKAKYNLILVTS